ncbi:MAG TPA: tyrosine-type recombinase/integrase [candidate division Zixibacteria bacterium]|nr:tyrosine-type recombinase/integrase [candidate division Zixibacteria bacterium]MDD4918408.1 tyrosine-type recombinase/integrase [candidate division Zixibacteria bacterium]MDM7972430.1 tyrosine-type recombinase/integrase [candidate division Zixibacteria bacterium]HPM38257.1 tyrosine-type recombinase/integrase [candidate division Zixibacteria bacterium]
MQTNVANAKIKRRYFERLDEADGLAESTIDAYNQAICRYEEYSGREDFRKFNRARAVGFKRWLEEGTGGRALSPGTVYHTLRYLRAFFTWLSGQAGYKSRISLDDVAYLALDKKAVQKVVASRPVRCPTLEYVLQLTGSISPQTDIDRRDQALIAFLLVSAMRDQAVATLPLGCLNVDSLVVSQDPNAGVQTKFSKTIVTTLMAFDDRLIGYVRDWARYLITVKLFGPADPLFPRSKIEQADGLCFSAIGVEPVFWKGTGPIREILKRRAAEAGLEYYHPHSFRHAAFHIAMRHCRTAEQLRAISQNFGHEHIATTLTSYGRLEAVEVDGIIRTMDFHPGDASGSGEVNTEMAKEILAVVEKHRRRQGGSYNE